VKSKRGIFHRFVTDPAKPVDDFGEAKITSNAAKDFAGLVRSLWNQRWNDSESPAGGPR
jgi:hypothetical protein